MQTYVTLEATTKIEVVVRMNGVGMKVTPDLLRSLATVLEQVPDYIIDGDKDVQGHPVDPKPWHDVGSPEEQARRWAGVTLPREPTPQSLFDKLEQELLENPPPAPKPFALEYGKRYQSRLGKEYGPLVMSSDGSNCEYPFFCPKHNETWRLNGTWSNPGPDGVVDQDHRDLIEEVP